MKNLITLIIILCVCSCATKKTVGKTAAEKLYNDAKILKKSGRFLLALEKINTIRSQYPYSYFATPAELLQADILFEQENYTEAAAAYILFRDFHPKHKEIEYVLYRIGDSFYRQLPSTFDRDLAATSDVIRYSNELVRRYPKSEYVEKAMENIKKCQQMRRDKDQYIADFYFKTHVFDSAGSRYLDILNTYGDDSKLRKHAILRLVESSKKQGKFADCVSHSKKFSDELESSAQSRVESMALQCQASYEKLINSENKEKS